MFDRFATELRRVARNLRARRSRAGLVVALLAVALAANAVVFSAADSLVFRRVPYLDAERLIEFGARDARTGRRTGYFAGPAILNGWRAQADLFDDVHAHAGDVIFLTGEGEPELVDAADVTVGLLNLLGQAPRWGRAFIDGDERVNTPQAVLIAESLARERFGDPARAVNQQLQTTASPLLIVGVMPESFRFPANTERIWRALDPPRLAARGQGLSLIARVAKEVPLDALPAVMAQRSNGLPRPRGYSNQPVAVPEPLDAAGSSTEQRRMLLVLIGAALCLLLLACGNVASLELAGAMTRARSHAIELAIGASRATLARTAMLEGICLVGTGALLGTALAHSGTQALVSYMPPSLLNGTANPVDLDERGLVFMAVIASAAWLLSAVPVAAFVWRTDLMDILKGEGGSVATSPAAARIRRGLTAGQVAVAVLLLVGSVVYVRSYLALLAIDKGFDSDGVISIQLTIPPQLMASGYERHVLANAILERVRSRPGVVAAFEGSAPPAMGDTPNQIDLLEMDDRQPFETDLGFSRLRVTPDYFKVLRIPLLAGRMLEPGEPPTNVLITDALWRRLWPDRNAVGRGFRESPTSPWHRVVGVVAHTRTVEDELNRPGNDFILYIAQQPPPPPTHADVTRTARNGALFRSLTVTARVDSRARVMDLFETVRSVDPRNILRLEFVDDRYALQFADRLLATRIVTGFGLMAFLIAAAGIYGLMTFLVAERTREIGIRMALGASRWDIGRLIMGGSLKLTLTGAVIGIFATTIAARWVQSQLYGVRALDPFAIGAVAGGVVLVALVATVRPARQAAKVDPTLLLR